MLSSTIAAGAVAADPQPLPYPPPIAAPLDRPFAGSIVLQVDATDTAHKVFAVHESIPVQGERAMTLLYPAWEDASHAATAQVGNLAGLLVHADGKRIEWQRDAIDSHAFHVVLPPGAQLLELEFQYLTRASDALLLPDLIDLPWPRTLLYPAGWFARNIAVAASVRLPAGLAPFSSLTALPAAAEGDGIVGFAPVTLDVLTDSPLYAARFSRRINLATGGDPAVWLDLLAQDPASLAASDSQLDALRRLVVQTRRLLGPPPYLHYDAIVTLSDVLPVGGVEHLASGENNLPAGYFTAREQQLNNLDLIAHEHVHAWNGRWRQPADLWTPTLNMPMRDSLLWVYEGQTEFWGRVLAARSGQRTQQETLDKLALDAAVVAARTGRSWKSLRDSNNDPLYMAGHGVLWRDWQRREDYYPEGVLLWLEVEARLREHSHGKYGVDDFARRFFAVHDARQRQSTYTFEQLCDTLAALAPFDWRGFLQARLDAHETGVPAGLALLGWQLTYTDTATATFLQDEAEAGVTDLGYSIGLTVNKNGDVRSVAWQGPAFNAGLAPGAHLVAVNGASFTPDLLVAAVKDAGTSPIELRYEADRKSHTVIVPYHGTLRYPRLVALPGRLDRLLPLLAAREAR